MIDEKKMNIWLFDDMTDGAKAVQVPVQILGDMLNLELGDVRMAFRKSEIAKILEDEEEDNKK